MKIINKVIFHLKKETFFFIVKRFFLKRTKKLLRKFFGLIGYQVIKTNYVNPYIVDVRNVKNFKDGYELYKYTKDNGDFDYDKYKSIQTARNHSKIDHFREDKHAIRYLASYIKGNISNIDFGLCHGTRTGKEQEWFSEYLGVKVIGTEISDTAENFANTIKWDFHDAKPEWINNVDFIYSNSLDHSYDPKKCIDTWVKCLKENGLLIIETGIKNTKATESDPFGIHFSLFPYNVLLWGEGKYAVKACLELPESYKNNIDKIYNTTSAKYFIIEKTEKYI